MFKTCTICGETKPIDQFKKHQACKSGYVSRCKFCVNRMKFEKNNPGIPYRPKPMTDRAISDDDFEKLVELYVEKGLTQAEVGEYFDVSATTIKKYLLRFNVPTRRTWAKNKRLCRGDCGKELPLSQFHTKDYVCKKCKSSYSRKKGWLLKSKYGISRKRYEKMLAEQNNSCEICGKSPDDNGRELAVDHCHETGHVRGLLCSSCNAVLGMSSDNVDILKKAIEYILKNKK